MNRLTHATLWAGPLLLATATVGAQPSAPARPTAAEAQRFIDRVDKDLIHLATKASRASWVAANFITDDTEELSAQAQAEFNVAVQRYAIKARRFNHVQLSETLRRKLILLKLALVAPPPGNPQEAAGLTRLQVGLEADYGKGTYCRKSAGSKDECFQLPDLEKILRESRDPNALLEAWQGWHTISRPMRQRYTRFVELSNKGARELGFSNTGEMWRSWPQSRSTPKGW